MKFHEILISDTVQREAGGWCQEKHGDRWTTSNHTGRWAMFWGGHGINRGLYRFCFVDEQDAVMFALRWL